MNIDLNNEEGKLKPIIFTESENKHFQDDSYVQALILKAISTGITDINELKKIAGASKAAEVYRSLNKLSIRKEYHDALIRNGIDLDFIVGKLKKVVEEAGSDNTKLAALQTFMKSLGLEKYEVTEEGGKGWEELLVDAREGKLGKPPEVDGTCSDSY